MPPEKTRARGAAPGPPLPHDWQGRFLAYYKAHGGLWRAAEAAGVSHTTVQRYRHHDPAFDQAVLDAREYHADTLEERMIAQAEASENPVGFIVRLKALRPAQYIEKNVSVSLAMTAELDPQDATQALARMLAHTTEATRAMLEAHTDALEPHTDTPSSEPMAAPQALDHDTPSETGDTHRADQTPDAGETREPHHDPPGKTGSATFVPRQRRGERRRRPPRPS